jgi:hypothetical protein
LKLTHREAVYLTLSDDETLAPRLPEVLTEELNALGFAYPAELFVLHTDVLSRHVARLIEKRCRMAGETPVFRYTVAEELAGFLSDAPLGKGAIGNIKEAGRLLVLI